MHITSVQKQDIKAHRHICVGKRIFGKWYVAHSGYYGCQFVLQFLQEFERLLLQCNDNTCGETDGERGREGGREGERERERERERELLPNMYHRILWAHYATMRVSPGHNQFIFVRLNLEIREVPEYDFSCQNPWRRYGYFIRRFRAVKSSGVRNLCVCRHCLGYDRKHVTFPRYAFLF